MLGQTTDEKNVEELVVQFEGKLDGYEAILGKQKYLAGDVRSPARNTSSWVLLMELDFVRRRSLSQICAICHMVVWSLSSSGMGV